MRTPAVLTGAALVRAGLGFAFAVLAIRTIGSSSFGFFTLIWSFATAFQFMYGGINLALVSRIVNVRALTSAGSSTSASSWMTAAMTITVMTVLVLACLSVLAWMLRIGPGEWPAVVPVCLAMLALQLTTSWALACAEGHGNVQSCALIGLIALGALCMALGACAVFSMQLSRAEFLALCLTCHGLECATALVLGVGAVWPGERVRPSIKQVASLLGTGASLQAANLVGFFLDPFTKGVLLHYVGPAAVAAFDVTMKLGWGLNSVFTSYARLFLQFPAADHAGRITALRQAARYTWVPALLISAIVVAAAPPFIATLTQQPTTLLASGMLLAMATGLLMIIAAPAYISLVAFQDHVFILRNQAILATGNVAGALLLVPLLGFLGAFLGAVLATTLNLWLISTRLPRHMPTFDGLSALASGLGLRLAVGATLLGSAWASYGAASTELSAPIALAVLIIATTALAREPVVRVTFDRVATRLMPK
jgi:O-antigen/teichoic acid export membrane protein